MGTRGTAGIPFKDFKLVMAKLWHAFTCIPAEVGLLSPCNRILKLHPAFVYLHKNRKVLIAIKSCGSLLRESTVAPTQCRKLTCGWPDYIGIVDASSYGVGGVVFGELSVCTPTVFRWQWPEDIHANIKTLQNRTGTISNLDLEMAGLLMLWLVIERGMRPASGKAYHIILQQLPVNRLGNTPCVKMIYGGGTSHSSPSYAPQNTVGMPVNPNSHKRETQSYCRHLATLIWE